MVVTLGSSMHTPIFSVLSFGSIAVDFSKENAALDALTNPLDPVWEAAELSNLCTTQTLFGLVEKGRQETQECHVVWEQQRGYLREHLGDPFVAEARRIGWPVKTMPPSEKYHRMGVSSNKQVRRLYYACFTEWSVGLDKCDTDKGIY